MREINKYIQPIAKLTNSEIRDVLRAIGARWEKEEIKYYNPGHPFNKNRDDAFCAPCQDHVRSLKINGERMCKMSPYECGMNEIKALVKYCEDRDLTFLIDGQASHFPGQTIRIIIRKDVGKRYLWGPKEIEHRG